MSRIVTFYSYKGGVGRTSALANVAVLLAKYGKNVLLMDWDLEAPGLDRYFQPYMKADAERSRGLIHMLVQSERNPTAKWEPFVSQIEIENCSPISIITSGDRSKDYVQLIRSFSWSQFFENRQGSIILDRWRNEWKAKYDYVFVDSRTGITDTGGVCTVFLPDILVLVFAANEQSFEGGLQIAQGIQRSRRDLAVPRPPLAILPLLGRFDGRDEVDESTIWLDRFSKELKPFYDDWLPKKFEPRRMLELTKIPYITKFSFGEPLPVLIHSLSDPEFPGFYLNNVARLIASDFADALHILSPDTGILQNTIAEIRSKLTEFPIDEGSVETLLRVTEGQFGKSAELCELLTEVGAALVRQRQFDAAEPYLRRAVAMSANMLEPNHPVVLSGLNNLADMLRDMGNLGEAEELYREVLLRLRSNSRPDDSALSTAYSNLAQVLHEKGNIGEAEEIYREALHILRDISRPVDPTLIRAYSNLASLLRDKGNLEEAETLYREALHRLRGDLRPDHPALNAALSNLAGVLRDKGNLEEAEALYRETLHRIRDTARPGDPALNRAYNSLAGLLREKGNLEEAEYLYREALDRLRDISRPGDPTLNRAYSNLASLLREKGNLNEAEHLYREALERLRTTSRPGDAVLNNAYSNLAGLLRERGNFAEAENLYREVLKRLRGNSRSGSPALLRAYSNLAGALLETGNIGEAEALYRQALREFENTSRRSSPQFAEVLAGLAQILVQQENWTEARSLLAQALAIQERIRGPDHRTVVATRNTLASLEKKPGPV